MNGLFVGPYKQNDGWGLASQDYIKAIATQIPNLTIRPIYYTRSFDQTDSSIKQYENTLFDSYDIVFQKVLPHNMVINNKIKKNVGMFVLETNNIKHSMCIPILNKLDEICVPSKQESKCLKSSGVTTNIKIVSQPLDIDFIQANIDHKLSFASHIETKNSFKFYTIGEFSERKNLLDLVLAFHLAFDPMDNVSLIIKTSAKNSYDQNARSIVEKEINNFKQYFGIRSRSQEIVITERLSNADIIGLHNACDCFVSTAKGEAFCRPAAEALVLGKTPIVTDNTGMVDFINTQNGYITQSTKVPVLLKEKPVSGDFDLYSTKEYWYEPRIYSVVENMRKVYETYKKNRKEYQLKKELGMNQSDIFRYENIGKKICDQIA